MSQASMREVAVRVFAREFNEATYTFTESDEERAPVYVLLPTGAKANRVFVVGMLTETEDLGEEAEYWRGRVVGPVSTFFVYAGQYQPDAAEMLRDFEPPGFVAVVGKPRTFETDSGTVNVSVQPEVITVVGEATRTRWVVETAERTIERIGRVDDPDNEYAAMAREQYNVSMETFRQDAIEALESLEEETSHDAGSGARPPDTAREARASEALPEDEATGEEGDARSVDADVIVTYLQDIGGGDAVDRETLMTTVSADFETSPDAIEAAVEEVLESGRCFRSGENELTPI